MILSKDFKDFKLFRNVSDVMHTSDTGAVNMFLCEYIYFMYQSNLLNVF